jgi:hypothetical protein
MAWCLVKHRDNFTFTLPFYANITAVNIKLRAVLMKLSAERLFKISYDKFNWFVGESVWANNS